MMRIGIVTNGYKGLNDELSEVFARASTITLIDMDIKTKNYKIVEILKNEAVDFSHGAGPILIKTLIDKGVDIVVGPNIGVGTQELMKEKKIRFLKFKPGIKVSEIISNILKNKQS